MTGIWISTFDIRRPRHQVPQAEALDWLVKAHVASEERRALESATEGPTDEPVNGFDPLAFEKRIVKLTERYACSSKGIGSRSSVLNDFAHNDFSTMRLYRLDESSHGRGTAERMRVFSEAARETILSMYQSVERPPADLIHVTCTGLVSPSPAQHLVSTRGWSTRVTHAYHMGCYAAVPALRLARGFALGDVSPDGCEARVDIVHTEFCSLHLDPSVHSPEQLVVQSLFADGSVRYSVSAGEERAGFELLGTSEIVVPGTEHSMTWVAGDYGMSMTLGSDVPRLLAPRLRDVVAGLLARADVEARDLRDIVFAVHPGGPKIIDQVRAGLELEERQVAASRAVLFECGNMSSATLPHVWVRLLEDDDVRPGTVIVSLAFGPGLTVAAALLRKS